MTNAGPVGRLVRIRVNGLLGRFDHDLEFDPEWRFLILHGPNGVGKTRLLELVHSVFTGDFLKIGRSPFKDARFDFEDGSWVEVARQVDQQVDQQGELWPARARGSLREAEFYDAIDSRWTFQLRHGAPSTHVVRLSRSRTRRRLTQFERALGLPHGNFDPGLDPGTGEESRVVEILERLSASLTADPEPESLPEPLSEFLKGCAVHLIETQRLLNPTLQVNAKRREGQRADPAVVSYARDLSRQLGGALALNSRTSQELDRSFPSRLFEDETTPLESEADIRMRYAKQLDLRGRLASIAILDPSPELQLPEQTLKDWQRKVLSTYLDDAEAKLNTFQDLLGRLELLKEIVNERFLFKRFEIDREEGFVVVDKDTGARVNNAELSSGEQHELVLMYDLLMNAGDHSLVLIDEPEISLHVAWQRAFLDDLDRVASLTSLRFIIATHSPQVIGDWWDQAVELYRVS